MYSEYDFIINKYIGAVQEGGFCWLATHQESGNCMHRAFAGCSLLAYSLYVRRGSVIAGEFEQWNLTVTAAESIAKCEACFLVFFSAVRHSSAHVGYS